MSPKDQNAVELGRRGGQASTPAQRLARQRNLYLGLAKKYPNSIKVAQRLRELEDK